MYSDHAPILAVPNSQRRRTCKPFRFENWWLMENEYKDIAKQSWQRSTNRDFSQKTKFLAADIRKWRKRKPRNSDLLQQIENQILQQQNLPPSLQDHTLQKNLQDKHQDLMDKEEIYHLQRAKKHWAIAGDGNTSFFYKAIVKRNRKNSITHLINPDGSHSTSPDQIHTTLINYFTNIFSSQNSYQRVAGVQHSDSFANSTNATASHHNLVMRDHVHLPNDTAFRYSYSIPTKDEIHSVIKQMRSNAAPGPDGLNAAFYKSSWEWTSQDIYALVTHFYSNAQMPSDLNHTFITLIQKKNKSCGPSGLQTDQFM